MCRPDKFGTYGFERKKVLKAIEVIKEAIKLTVRLQAVVEEEERCFKAFSVWLHYGTFYYLPSRLSQSKLTEESIEQSSTNSLNKKVPKFDPTQLSIRSPSPTTSNIPSLHKHHRSTLTSRLVSLQFLSRKMPQSRVRRNGSNNSNSVRRGTTRKKRSIRC